jgi:hypothetical protein
MAIPNDPNSSPRRPWEARLSEAAARIEAELRATIKTVDDEVIPEVRRHSSSALRTLAAKLDRLAQSMDDARRETPPKGEGQ